MALILALLGCDTHEVTPTPAAPELVPLDPARLARRTSLDLRGVLPSIAELDAVEADPSALAGLRAEWMTGRGFEDRFTDLLAERWLTRVDEFLVYSAEYEPLRDEETIEYAFERAMADEPLRLMAHVAANDLPWSEIVTADYTLANGILASIWPIDHPGGDDWAVSRYTDGRPAAGVLASNGLWIRYYTTDANKNRRRAAVVADLLLCQDYLQRPVDFDAGDTISGDPEEALRTNPYCLGCHSSLDPLAVLLFGFYTSNSYNVDDISTYHPEREQLGPQSVGVEPAYYGTPVSGLAGLGQAIAADPRFDRCTTETMAALYWRRGVTSGDFDRILGFEQAFTAGERRLSTLLEAVLADPVYQAGAPAAGQDASGERLARLMSPDVLDSALGAWAGFTWETEGFEQLRNDDLGYRVLAGGVDGALVTEAQTTPGLTWELTVRRVAQAAAAAALESGVVDATLTPDDSGFEAALTTVHRQLLAERPDATRLAELTALWQEVAALSDGPTAWAAVLEALLRDPLWVTL